MQRFQWNALRLGDHVAIHDDQADAYELMDGEVVIVQPAVRTNDIAFRVRPHAATASVVVRPRRHAVHLLPVDADEDCWRCAAPAPTTAAAVAETPVPA